MAPQQHLDWFEDNIAWFESLALEDLTTLVPSCPGWSVQDVVNHLSFGLGLAYPVGMSKPPKTEAAQAFDGVAWPETYPTGNAALEHFSINMRGCRAVFGTTHPETPCWTYGGPGAAKFWFRRAAIETAMHRMDVEEALHGGPARIPGDRVADAVVETVEFVLPLAAEMTGQPDGKLTVSSPVLDQSLDLGAGQSQASISGDGQEILLALWGRHVDVVITGDRALADEWLTLTKTAFAGR